MNHQQLIAHYESRQPQMLETIEALVVEETPTDDKKRLDIFSAKLADRYMAAGMEPEFIANPTRGNHLRASFNSARACGESQCGAGAHSLPL